MQNIRLKKSYKYSKKILMNNLILKQKKNSIIKLTKNVNLLNFLAILSKNTFYYIVLIFSTPIISITKNKKNICFKIALKMSPLKAISMLIFILCSPYFYSANKIH